MANKVVDRQAFTFVAGLNTEAGFFTFPENTWQAGNNLTPLINGEIVKRNAVDFEENYINILASTINESNEENYVFSVNVWTNVNGTSTQFAVVQIGHMVYFFENSGYTLSDKKKAFSIDLRQMSGVVTKISSMAYNPIDISSANGKLLVCHKYVDPFIIEYNSDTDDITTTSLDLKMRDLYGIDESTLVDGVRVTPDIDYQPTGYPPYDLTQEHHYNLNNQGWDDTHLATYKNAAVGKWPSNAQTWWQGKDSSDVFQRTLLDLQDFGTSPAPKGRKILSIFNRVRTATHINITPVYWGSYDAGTFDTNTIETVSTEVEYSRPTTICFWAGRAWYAGVEGLSIGNWVMFSQASLDDSKFDRCYQEADPTSEMVSDLIDSDGGVIPIHGLGKVVKLHAFSDSLLLFADNGVWRIYGGQGQSFSATGYAVTKLSSVGAVSSTSIIDVDSTITYMSPYSINTITFDQSGLNLVVQSITDLSIKSLVASIPTVAKEYVKAIYDSEAKVVVWLYNADTSQDGVSDRYKKTNAILFDIRIKCFYTYTFPVGAEEGTTPYIVDAMLSNSRYEIDETFSVIRGADSVVDSSANEVVATFSYPVGNTKIIKFLCCNPIDVGSYNFTFGDFASTYYRDTPERFRDWYNKDSTGIALRSYIITGYDMLGDSDKKKQALYITVHSRKTETGYDDDYVVKNPSSCLMQTQWDFTDSADAGKWSAEQQVYRHVRLFVPTATTDVQSAGYPVITTKNKVRGRGRSVAIKFSDEADKDMRIIGWEAIYVANSNV